HILPQGVSAPAVVGSSRLGGLPDLASGASWPRSKSGGLLTFYGQINLEDVAVASGSPLLPSAGLLSIFAGAIESSYAPIELRLAVTAAGTPLSTIALPDGPVAFADENVKPLDAVSIRCEPGLSLPTENMRFMRELEIAAPDGDIDTLLAGLSAAPTNAIGQILGYAQFPSSDVHRDAYFAEIGRADQGRLEIWEDWEAWEAAKLMQSRLRNGQIYRPWSAKDDENVRWLLANKAAIASGIEQWHSILWIASNRLMNLWINDADPIYILAKIDDAGHLDLSNAWAGATQS
ncbi:MAG: DUF1963 domain-containing protein, partial [Massilia sp.]